MAWLKMMRGSWRIISWNAELCGVSSHGIIRVPQYLDALRTRAFVRTGKSPSCTKVRRPRLEGGHGFGQVMVYHAMEQALKLATRCGVGVVTLINCGHSGRLGYYTTPTGQVSSG